MTELAVHRDSMEPQRAFVALFDVLGFKELLSSKPLNQVISSYRSLIDVKRQAARIPVGRPGGVSVEVSGTTVFSDTILLWCDDSWPAVQSLLTSCNALIAESLALGMPLRGGVAFGEAVLDRVQRVFVGQPIVDAHLTEASQEWLGAALHSSVLNHPTLGSQIASLEDIISYRVPVKPNAPTLTHALHWCPYAKSARSSIVELKAATNNRSAICKFNATLAYLSEECTGYHAAS